MDSWELIKCNFLLYLYFNFPQRKRARESVDNSTGAYLSPNLKKYAFNTHGILYVDCISLKWFILKNRMRGKKMRLGKCHQVYGHV